MNFTHSMLQKQSRKINMEKYLQHCKEKIKHLTHLAKKQSQSPNLMDTMEEHAFEDILDRLHKYHSRKQMIEKYLT